jgi:hypothetical protein
MTDLAGRTQKQEVEPRLKPNEQWLNSKAAAFAGVKPGIYRVPQMPEESV